MGILCANPLAPIPPVSLIGRVIGSENAELFVSSGKATISDWSRALALIQRTFRDFPRIVDFGCGCGRTIRHLRPMLQDSQELVGMDVDCEAVTWVAHNYPTVIGHTISTHPPCALGSGSVDLILNQSVFTHLPEDAQFAWLQELHRIAKSDAFLILSFHGLSVWEALESPLRANGNIVEAEELRAAYNTRGFHHTQGRNSLEQALPEYYGVTLHSIDYVIREWAKWFSIVAWLPRYSLGHQDIVLLRKQ
jgi:SAM-dependent methyltransferase